MVQFAGPGLRLLLGLALVAALSRSLGVAGLGRYALVFAYVAVFSGVLADWGLGTVCVREMSRRPAERVSLIAGSATLQALIAIGSYAAMLASLLVMRYPMEVTASIALYGLTVLLTPLDILALPFQVDLRLSRLLPPSILGTALNFVLVIAVIIGGGPLIALVGASAVSLAVQYGWTARLSLPMLGVPFRPTRAHWGFMLREAWPLALSTTVSSALQQTPILVLSLVSLQAVGLFNAANKIPMQLLVIPLAIRGTIFPLLSATWVADRSGFVRTLERSIAGSLLVSIPVAVFGIGMAQPIIHLLFGPSFAGATLPFALLLGLFPIMFPGILLGEALIAAGHQRLNLAILAASIPLLAALMVALVPGGGAAGAALALLCYYAVVFGVVLITVGRSLGVTAPLRALPRAGAAVFCGFAILILTRELGPMPSALAGALGAFAILALHQLETVRHPSSWPLLATSGSDQPDTPGTLRALLPHLGIRRRLRRFRHAIGLEPIRTTTYLGRPFLYPADSLIGRSIAKGQEWDAVLGPLAARLLLEDAPLVCEVGSNIGASLLQILSAKPRARVLAFEPSDRFRPLLERNLKLAGFGHVEIVSMLLGRASGRASLYNNGSSASVLPAEYDGHEPRGTQMADMTTLDQALHGRGPVHFIKLDTDGFDFEVLRGAQDVLRRDKPVLFFELPVHLLTSPQADLAWLRQFGYHRLVCLTPSPAARVIGTTTDPDEAISWAQASGYCDVLVTNEASK
jgi:FkbM family methyltransferase